MDALSRHYHQLVGLNDDWVIGDVQLDTAARTLTLLLEFVGSRVTSPECGASCAMQDHAPERRWRHPDATRFQTIMKRAVARGLERRSLVCLTDRQRPIRRLQQQDPVHQTRCKRLAHL
jgi:hypothetical protein